MGQCGGIIPSMASPSSRFAPPRDAVLAFLALAVVVALTLSAPHSLLDKADRAGYAVCHRLADHSFMIGGRQLPLCARCSGTYLGAFAGLAVLALLGRGRAGRFPTRPQLLVLAAFMLAWAIDGTNSFLALMGWPHLYEPGNWLRLATGTLEGIAIAAVLLPALNLTLWRRPDPRHSIGGWRDLAWLLAGGGMIILAVSSETDALLFPLALLSGAMIPVLLGVLNAMLYLAGTHREGRAERRREVVAPLLIGLALALGEIALIGIAREALTTRFGLPF